MIMVSYNWTITYTMFKLCTNFRQNIVNILIFRHFGCIEVKPPRGDSWSWREWEIVWSRVGQWREAGHQVWEDSSWGWSPPLYTGWTGWIFTKQTNNKHLSTLCTLCTLQRREILISSFSSSSIRPSVPSLDIPVITRGRVLTDWPNSQSNLNIWIYVKH